MERIKDSWLKFYANNLIHENYMGLKLVKQKFVQKKVELKECWKVLKLIK